MPELLLKGFGRRPPPVAVALGVVEIVVLRRSDVVDGKKSVLKVFVLLKVLVKVLVKPGGVAVVCGVVKVGVFLKH